MTLPRDIWLTAKPLHQRQFERRAVKSCEVRNMAGAEKRVRREGVLRSVHPLQETKTHLYGPFCFRWKCGCRLFVVSRSWCSVALGHNHASRFTYTIRENISSPRDLDWRLKQLILVSIPSYILWMPEVLTSSSLYFSLRTVWLSIEDRYLAINRQVVLTSYLSTVNSLIFSA